MKQTKESLASALPEVSSDDQVRGYLSTQPVVKWGVDGTSSQAPRANGVPGSFLPLTCPWGLSGVVVPRTWFRKGPAWGEEAPLVRPTAASPHPAQLGLSPGGSLGL